MQGQRVQTLQDVVQNVRLLDGRQFGQQLIDVLESLRQTVQIVLEFADRCLPELLLRSIVVIVVRTVNGIVGGHCGCGLAAVVDRRQAGIVVRMAVRFGGGSGFVTGCGAEKLRLCDLYSCGGCEKDIAVGFSVFFAMYTIEWYRSI